MSGFCGDDAVGRRVRSRRHIRLFRRAQQLELRRPLVAVRALSVGRRRGHVPRRQREYADNAERGGGPQAWGDRRDELFERLKDGARRIVLAVDGEVTGEQFKSREPEGGPWRWVRRGNEWALLYSAGTIMIMR